MSRQAQVLGCFLVAEAKKEGIMSAPLIVVDDDNNVSREIEVESCRVSCTAERPPVTMQNANHANTDDLADCFRLDRAE